MVAAIALLVLVAALPCRGADRSPAELPRDTEPYYYDLRLVPDIGCLGYGGDVGIWINVNRDTSNVTLHARDLWIDKVSVTDADKGAGVVVKQWTLCPETERLIVTVGGSLLAGRRFVVRIQFHGLLRTDMTGFYRSQYTEFGLTKCMAVTQFKPTYARRAFPCYDEPIYKTTFNISLGRQIYQKTLSNTFCYKTENIKFTTFWLDHYEPTSPISTYMVAVMVGEMRNVTKKGFVSIYTHYDYSLQTTYAQEESPALIKTMETYTDMLSETPKIIYLAAPDFEGDGVENRGLNIYRERYVLIDEDAKTKFREQSTMVIQQMQSHQWFGNLVTCSKWDFMWLNEGFARYFQYFATKQAKPDWRMEDLFVIEQHQTALEYDQIPRHPMTTSVVTSDDVLKIIDRITYNKAASFLRMLSYTVTENNFHQPLKLYLQNFTHSVVSPADLWSEFEKYYFDTDFQLGDFVPLTEYVYSWTDQSGYPVVNVIRENDTCKITQNRFSVWPTDDTNTRWFIGLTYTDNLEKNFDNLVPVKWLKPSNHVTIMYHINLSGWVIFNLQSTGCYRVNYDEENWNQLIKQLKKNHTDIHVLNRAQLIDDSFNLARAGVLKYSIALDLSTYLYKEDDCVPWHTAIDSLSYIVERMRRSVGGILIKSYVQSLVDLIYAKTEFLIIKNNSKDHMTLTSRNKFSVWSCYYDGVVCTGIALQNFNKWIAGVKISPDVKDAALCTGMKFNKDPRIWQLMFLKYKTTYSFSEKDSIQLALACTDNIALLNEYLEFLFISDKGGPVRLQDYYDIVSQMALTPIGIEALTVFLTKNLEIILNTMQAGEKIVTHMYRVLATKVALDSEIVQIYQLKNLRILPPRVKASFEESYMHVKQNQLWYKNNQAAIIQWIVLHPIKTIVSPTHQTSVSLAMPSIAEGFNV